MAYEVIQKINNVTYLGKQPSSMEYDEEDVSSSKAGRTEDGTMHKERIAQKVTLKLEWKGLTTAEIATVLAAFADEYISVTYLSPRVGTYTTKTFYVGGRSAPCYSSKLGLWEKCTFNIIEQ